MKIKINTNCKNGEHVFIPANTFVDGRDHFVTSFVCQHCLYGVSQEDWHKHLEEINKPLETISNEDPIDIITGEAGQVFNGKTMKWDTPTKKRGPKPRGKIEGLPID